MIGSLLYLQYDRGKTVLELQLRPMIEKVKERQESALTNNPEYGLLNNVAPEMKVKSRKGSADDRLRRTSRFTVMARDGAWVDDIQGVPSVGGHPDQILDTQGKQAIDSQMTAKGFTKLTDGGKPDLLVGYQLMIDREKVDQRLRR